MQYVTNFLRPVNNSYPYALPSPFAHRQLHAHRLLMSCVLSYVRHAEQQCLLTHRFLIKAARILCAKRYSQALGAERYNNAEWWFLDSWNPIWSENYKGVSKQQPESSETWWSILLLNSCIQRRALIMSLKREGGALSPSVALGIARKFKHLILNK